MSRQEGAAWFDEEEFQQVDGNDGKVSISRLLGLLMQNIAGGFAKIAECWPSDYKYGTIVAAATNLFKLVLYNCIGNIASSANAILQKPTEFSTGVFLGVMVGLIFGSGCVLPKLFTPALIVVTIAITMIMALTVI